MSEREDLRESFLQDTAPLVAEVGDRLIAIERAAESLAEDWRQLLGLLHTIKGNCGMMQVEDGERLAHAMERRAGAARDAPLAGQVDMLGPLLSSAAALEDAVTDEAATPGVEALVEGLDAGVSGDSDPAAARRAAAQAIAVASAHQRMPHIRIEAEVLDRLLELVGELVLCSRRVRTAGAGAAAPGARHADRDEALELLNKHVNEMRQRVLDARLVPLRVVVSRFRRLVRDLATATEKRLALVVEGEDTVVDKAIADQLGEPLMHLLRNAADHGIEPAAQRREAGKPETGRLELRIEPAGGDLLVRLRDDGRGLSRARLEEAAARHGIRTAGWTDREVHDLIFHPDFSTAESVTRLSGRGVGMPQIRRAVERMGGDLRLETREGRGTEFSVRVPLAAAIRRTLVVDSGGEEYAVPIESVAETFRVSASDLYPVDRGWITSWRERILPSQYLARQLGGRAELDADASLLCVVIEDSGRHAGLLVDDIRGQQDVVVRDLDPALGRPRGIAGLAIVGEGRVAMVLDPRSLPYGEARPRAEASR